LGGHRELAPWNLLTWAAMIGALQGKAISPRRDSVNREAMKALVTGGAGFIGRPLARALLGRGDDVVLLDIAYPGGVLGGLEGRVETHVGDVARFSDVLEAVRRHRPDTVFHLAALLSSGASARPTEGYHVNIDGFFHALEAARLFDVHRFVFTSSIASFGGGFPDPVPNEQDQKPLTLYGVSKVFGERLGELYQRTYGLEFRAIRLPSVLGPGRGDGGVSAYSTHVIERPMRGEAYDAYCRPDTRIPLLFLGDAVDGLLRIHDAPGARLSRCSYNVQGFSPTAGEIAAEVRRRVPDARIGFRPDPAKQAILDSWPRTLDDTLARKEWGWAPSYDLSKTVDAYRRAIRTARGPRLRSTTP
jgi:threonine 3-dehydrogenase